MKRNIFYIIFIAISGILLSSCAEDSADKIDYSSLVTGTPEIVTGSTVVKNYGIMLTVEGGKVVSGDPITERGICVSTNNNPQIYTETETGYTYGKVFAATSVNSEDGTFTAVLTGLVPETSYYYRSYATNAKGVHYGEVKTLKTAALPTVVSKQVSYFWGAVFDVNVAYIPDANLYVLQKIYTGVEEVDDTVQGGLYDINITINKNGTLTIAKQAAWNDNKYGLASVQGSGTVSEDGKILTLTLAHSVTAGSLGSAKEVITLP